MMTFDEEHIDEHHYCRAEISEQRATIETLRRRVAELEEHVARHHREAIDKPVSPHKAYARLQNEFRKLTAENAELTRQVESLESQLAARNQAAEAMGVLERWLTDGSKEIDISRTGDVREVLLCEHHGATTAKYGTADSLIEAVLKAGGASRYSVMFSTRKSTALKGDHPCN